MSEPFYEYVKGQGWVPSFEDSREYTLKGKRYRVIARKPNIGERCIWSAWNNRMYTINGKANLDNWIEYYLGEGNGRYYEDLTICTPDTYDYAASRVAKPVFITVVPC
jgi:hypothetical protein